MCKGTATPEECVAALRRLTDDQLRQLKQVARIRVTGLHAIDWQDLHNEAIVRMLDGRRRWPRHIPLVVFLVGTMRSIANDYWRRLDDPLVVAESELGVEGETRGGGVVEQALDGTGGPERRVSAQETLALVEAEFAADADALAIVRGIVNGQGPDEIQKETGMDTTRYATSQRRIRRRLAKAFPEGGN